MFCKCKNKSKVVDTRSTYNEVYRKHYCESCGRTFYTIEFEVEENEQFENEWKRLSCGRYKR